MELVKREDHWALYNEDGHKIAATILGCNSKLSLKNCEAIERGYDLMDLAEEDSNKYYDLSTVSWHCNYNGFFSGFQKALELLGDKKYSEDNLLQAIEMYYGEDKIFIEIIKSLQQTEWDVTIVTKNSRTGKIVNSDYDLEWDEDGLCDVAIPKLDDNGCLILKRKV